MPSGRAAVSIHSRPAPLDRAVAAHIPLRPRARAARVASTASIARASIEARASHRIANRIASRTAGVVLDEADGVSNVAASLAQLLLDLGLHLPPSVQVARRSGAREKLCPKPLPLHIWLLGSRCL